jgi:UDP-glucose 4-epimerase
VRIVVTGASGNIGTALLRRLAGGHHVVGVCRRPPCGGEPYRAAGWVALDLADPDAERALQPVVDGADAVVHLAWGFQPSRDAGYLERVGVGGTRAVLGAARAAGVPHLVHLSSLGVYSPGPGRQVDETWPTEGIASLPYSRHKVAAERLLDEHEHGHGSARSPAVARLRPGLVMQPDAGSALLRYGAPPYLPSAVLRHVPLLPLDRGLAVPVVHSDDVAAAAVAVLDRRATGAFNLAAEPPVTRDVIARVLGARPVHVPRPVLRAAAGLGWRTHLLRLDPGWLDLAFAVPLLDSGRARRELGWEPAVPADAALGQALGGMAAAGSTASPALRRRSVAGELAALAVRGPISRRRLP